MKLQSFTVKHHHISVHIYVAGNKVEYCNVNGDARGDTGARNK